MASPDLLCERVLEAIEKRDETSLQRWVKHPRFDPLRPANAKALQACLRHDDAPVWMDLLSQAGVNLRSQVSGAGIMEEAVRKGHAEGVRWLLEKGLPATTFTAYGNPVLAVVLNDLEPPKPSHAQVVVLLWERLDSIHDLIGWQANHVKTFIERAPTSWVEALLEAGWDPTKSENGEPSVWEQAQQLTLQEDRGCRAALEQWHLEQRLPSASRPESRCRL